MNKNIYSGFFITFFFNIIKIQITFRIVSLLKLKLKLIEMSKWKSKLYESLDQINFQLN